MCGIVGYIGDGNVYDILIKGLHRLEYRGYDSAGVALVGRDGKLNVYKAKGKVTNLEAYCEQKDLDAVAGIAHTRWATHGEPSDTNAHPHYSEDGNIALVHNGTIENYRGAGRHAVRGIHQGGRVSEGWRDSRDTPRNAAEDHRPGQQGG